MYAMAVEFFLADGKLEEEIRESLMPYGCS
jgi:hypothetical protein